MRKGWFTLSILFLLLAKKTAHAQEVQLTGPLKGAPPAHGLRLYREGRFEIAPSISFTLLDEYRRTILTGARLHYNITDWIGIGVWGGYGAISTATDLTEQIDAKSVRDERTQKNIAPDAGGFKNQTAKIQWIAAPQVIFVPFRGKFSLFHGLFADTDAYLHAGLAFVGLKERGDCGGDGSLACTEPSSFDLKSRMALAPTFGLGLNFYLSNFISLGLEYRALPFSWNRAGFDSRGSGPDEKFPDGKVDSSDRTFRFNQMLTVAIGFSFPTKPAIRE